MNEIWNLNVRSPCRSGFLKIVLREKAKYKLDLLGCETLSLTLREEHRLRVFENGVLRRIFGPRRDEVTGG
jgi:hypothetical protein